MSHVDFAPDKSLQSTVGYKHSIGPKKRLEPVTLNERQEAAHGLLDVHSTPPIIRSPDTNKVIVQLEVAYMHTDTENNIVFMNKSFHEPGVAEIFQVKQC